MGEMKTAYKILSQKTRWKKTAWETEACVGRWFQSLS